MQNEDNKLNLQNNCMFSSKLYPSPDNFYMNPVAWFAKFRKSGGGQPESLNFSIHFVAKL